MGTCVCVFSVSSVAIRCVSRGAFPFSRKDQSYARLSSTGILMISTVTSSMHCFCEVMTSRPGDLIPCFEGYGKMGLWDMSLIQEGAAPYGVPGAWVLMIIPRKLTSEPPTPNTPKTCVVSRTIVNENAPDRWIVSV